MNPYFIFEFYILVTTMIALFSLIFDLVVSDPESKLHPVNLIGKSLNWLKKKIRTNLKLVDKLFGILLLVSVVALFCIPIYFFQIIIYYFFVSINLIMNNFFAPIGLFSIFIFSIIMGFLLKWSFSIRYLGEVTKIIQNELEAGNIEKSRHLLSFIVRRNTKKLDEPHIISATVEVIAESSTDSVISTFWFYYVGNLLGLIIFKCFHNHFGWLFLGIPFAYMYRIINTGDSVVGYKDPEHINIGWFSAKLDDISNYIPTRLTVLLMLLSGKIYDQPVKNGWKILKRDKNITESVNAGWIMSTIAGLLGVQLEKIGKYKLGDPIRSLNPCDITLTYKIIVFTIFSFILIIGFLFVVIESFLIIIC